MTDPVDERAALALALRCEQASGPDRELDAAIYMAANPRIKLAGSRPLLLKRVWPTINGGADCFWYETKNGCMGGIKDCPYTASLDAAMTLLGEGFYFGAGNDGAGDGGPSGWAWASSCDDFEIVRAATPALALCAAALRAHLIAKDQTHD